MCQVLIKEVGIVSSPLCMSWTPGESTGGCFNWLPGNVNPYQQDSPNLREQQPENLSRIPHSISACTAYVLGSPKLTVGTIGLGGGQRTVENK